MKISVVVPAYNEEQFIGNCLASLSDQTEKAFEIIVVDNNCTDRTVEIAKSYGVSVLPEKQKGVIFARNAGFSAARGDIIARTDADCRVPRDWIAKIRRSFEDSAADGLAGTVAIYDLPFKNPAIPNFVAWISAKIAGNKELTIGPNMALTKAMWGKIRNHVCLDQWVVHEDYDISLWIYAVGGNVVRDPSNVVMMSGRRIVKDPGSFFIEYPWRVVKTFRLQRTFA